MELDEAIQWRTSISYTPKDTLRELIKAAIRAPTASGLFVAYMGEEAKERIYKLLVDGHIEYFEERGLPEEKIQKLIKRFEKGMYRAPLYLGVFINKEVKALKDESWNFTGHWRVPQWQLKI
ncbi:nitroreductase family protein [Thermococcus sp.]